MEMTQNTPMFETREEEREKTKRKSFAKIPCSLNISLPTPFYSWTVTIENANLELDA